MCCSSAATHLAFFNLRSAFTRIVDVEAELPTRLNDGARRFRRVRVRDEGRGQRAAARGGRVLSAQCRSHARTAGVARGRDRAASGSRRMARRCISAIRWYARFSCAITVRAAMSRTCGRRGSPMPTATRTARSSIATAAQECAVGRQAGGALRAGRCRDGSHRGADRAAELHARRRRPPVRDERAHRVERRCVLTTRMRVACSLRRRGTRVATARFAGTPRG